MARVASQGSLVLETKLSGYLKKLSAMAEFFQEGELHTEKNMEILRNISNEMQQDFQRFALADLEGNSWVTNVLSPNRSKTLLDGRRRRVKKYMELF